MLLMPAFRGKHPAADGFTSIVSVSIVIVLNIANYPTLIFGKAKPRQNWQLFAEGKSGLKVGERLHSADPPG
jgi:hypothetical protein